MSWPQFAFVVIVQVADSASPSHFLVSLLWFDFRKSCDVLSVHLLRLTPEVPCQPESGCWLLLDASPGAARQG